MRPAPETEEGVEERREIRRGWEGRRVAEMEVRVRRR